MRASLVARRPAIDDGGSGHRHELKVLAAETGAARAAQGTIRDSRIATRALEERQSGGAVHEACPPHMLGLPKPSRRLP